MMKRVMFSLFFLQITLFAQATNTNYSQTVTLDQVMNSQTQQEIGINRLSAKQKKALEQWLTGYTLHFVMQGISQGTTPSSTSQTAIKNMHPSGQYLQLNNNSVYQVSSNDQATVQNWQSGQDLSTERSQDAHYNTRLVNSQTNQKANARKMPTAQSPYMNSTLPVSKVDPDSGVVSFGKGSSFRVSKNDRVLMSGWLANQPITVQSTNMATFPYLLENQATHQSIYAEKLSKQEEELLNKAQQNANGMSAPYATSSSNS